MSRSRRGFTLIELMVVISIIAVLAAMVMAVVGLLQRDAKKERTKAILAAMSKGIDLTAAAIGSTISPVEHPLAGSRAIGSRFQFMRYSTPHYKGTKLPAAGTPLDVSAIALSGLASTAQLPLGSGADNQLMLPSDLYADPRSYLLYGLKREFIGVLGAQQKRVTKYIQLPRPPQGQQNLAAALYPLLTTAALPLSTIPSDAQDADPAFGHPAASKQTIDFVFGSSGIQTELAGLNALYLADPTTYANGAGAGGSLAAKANAFRYPVNHAAIAGDTSPDLVLLYTDGHPQANWQPGCIAMSGGIPTADDAAPAPGSAWTISGPAGASWLHYRLPGLAIYDAWKVEVLYSVSAQGGMRLMSAGADGTFQFNPGVNKVLDSIDPELAPSGDDQDGAKDNIVVRAEEQQ